MEKLTFDMAPSNDSVNITGLKMVKNANIFSENGVYFIRHYSTIIFAYDPRNHACEAKMNCSTTSNRQIRNALNFFGIDNRQVKDTSNGSKWAYSGERSN